MRVSSDIHSNGRTGSHLADATDAAKALNGPLTLATSLRNATVFNASFITTLAWGALAFGAEYSWAYSPLCVMCFLTSISAARVQGRGSFAAPRALLSALLIVFLAGVASLVPALGPLRSTAPVIDYGRLFTDETRLSLPLMSTHVLSIAPARTLLSLTFLASLTVLLAGCTSAIGALNPRPLVRAILILGVVVAVVGIVQAGVQSQAVYGIWRTPKPETPFAPFVNRNHFSGWMVMVISLAMGWLAGDLASVMTHVTPRWRSRLLWFSSPAANEVILTIFAVVVMALSVVVTQSRGGLIGLATAIGIGAWWMLRRQPSRARRSVAFVLLLGILGAAAAWGNAERTVDRFLTETASWGGRRSIWLDASHIARDYPLTGTGLNTFGIAMLHYQTQVNGPRVIEAHNDYLQLAAEGGLMLGIPIGVTIALLVREIARRFQERADDARVYWLRVGAVAGLGAIAVMEIFDFTLQMPGAAVMFVFLVAIAIHKPDYLRRSSTSRIG